MAVLGVVPRKERSAVARGVIDPEEATRKTGGVLQGLELRLRERVVIGDLGPTQRSRHTEIGKQLRRALARHGGSTIGMQGQNLRLDALLDTRFFDQSTGQRRVLPVGHHPAHRVAAEDVEQDVEVVVRPLLRPQQFRVGSDRSALPLSREVSFSGPPSEPDVRLSPHPALHMLFR